VYISGHFEALNPQRMTFITHQLRSEPLQLPTYRTLLYPAFKPRTFGFQVGKATNCAIEVGKDIKNMIWVKKNFPSVTRRWDTKFMPRLQPRR
jgi:hypothetical protein